MLARSLFRIFLVSTLGNLVTLIFGYLLVHGHFEPTKVNLVRSHSSSGSFKGHRLAFELGKPLGFDLAGYQLQNQEKLIFGWQKAY